MVGWSDWAYEDCCGSAAAILADGSRSPTAPGNLRLAELNTLVRPYPRLIAGTPTAWAFDPARAAFSLHYSTHRLAGGRFAPGTDTEIELPALRYPTGYTVAVRGARVSSAPDANLLRLLARPGAQTVALTVTPSPHHRPAPGPFRWPAGTPIAATDCPASAAPVVRIRARSGDPVTRMIVVIDGHRVAQPQGAALQSVSLPRGLADGSEVRLRATTALGGHPTLTQTLRNCRPARASWTP